MNRLILTAVTVYFLTLGGTARSFAQQRTYQDTIIKVEGKVMPVDVSKVTSNYVSFYVDGSDEVFRIPRKEIHKIIYKTGKVDHFNKLVLMMVDDYAWEAVWLTENKEDVLNLYNRGVIKAQSQASSRSPKQAKKNAIIRLQKMAASKGGQVVLITKKHATGGYGEFPGYVIEGIAYGPEPLEEEGAEDEIL